MSKGISSFLIFRLFSHFKFERMFCNFLSGSLIESKHIENVQVYTTDGLSTSTYNIRMENREVKFLGKIVVQRRRHNLKWGEFFFWFQLNSHSVPAISYRRVILEGESKRNL